MPHLPGQDHANLEDFHKRAPNIIPKLYLSKRDFGKDHYVVERVQFEGGSEIDWEIYELPYYAP